ncbi:MAG: NADH-quinone oxidoreductase subunit H [Anaerolineae bacterium]|nr:NADH-quinone oxidoreductase subunit H [Anaerolineae bacterium]
MNAILPFVSLLIFPGGLFLIGTSLFYEFVDRKLVARYQNRVGPRWFQPLADIVKLLAKEEIIPFGVQPGLFIYLPVIGLAGALTAALYVPMFGFTPAYSFRGDLIVALYLLSMMTLCLGLAGANTIDRFSLIGATRTLTQLFSYEAPFLLALLGPALAAQSWQISDVNVYSQAHVPMAITQIIGFIVAIVGLMGKLELTPFDAPEAETEIVSGALTEYSGRGLALFRIGKNVEMVIAHTLVAAFYLGGLAFPFEGMAPWLAIGLNVLIFLAKTLGLMVFMAGLQSLFTRLRIDQTVGMWWRLGALLALINLLLVVVLKTVGVGGAWL